MPSVLTEGQGDGRATCLEHRVVSGTVRRHGTLAWRCGEEFLWEVTAELILEGELMKPRGLVEQGGEAECPRKGVESECTGTGV